MKAVILAGGKGTRLKPYTTLIPKPLMPLGDRAILEVVIAQLKKNGISDVVLAVGHMAELIQAYFGDGRKRGVTISYSKEDEPLGTSGPLGKISGLNEFHKKEGAAVTIAVHKRSVTIDFGVLGLDGSKVTSYTEKPTLDYEVSMGINIMEPRVLEIIKEHEILDFPDLITILIEKGENVSAYVTDAYWLDIGRPDDYVLAVEEFASKKETFLG
jgi:NDP-mannose synthase